MNNKTEEQNKRSQILLRLSGKDKAFIVPHLTLFIAFLLILFCFLEYCILDQADLQDDIS